MKLILEELGEGVLWMAAGGAMIGIFHLLLKVVTGI